MKVSIWTSYVLTFSSKLVYSTLNAGCVAQGSTSVHVAFHGVYYPYSHNGVVLILICATLGNLKQNGSTFHNF